MGSMGTSILGSDLPKPGSTTKPDGTTVTTNEEKKGDNTVTTIKERTKNGTVTTKIITTRPDGSQHLDTRVTFPAEKLDPEKLGPEAASLRNDGASEGENKGITKIATKEGNGKTVTMFELTKTSGPVNQPLPKKFCSGSVCLTSGN
uniref:G5 domain-containing protein n=1 Tax=Steinernema glaseri TaxID=37863 RepID=A0A1I7Z4H7_9BILA